MCKPLEMNVFRGFVFLIFIFSLAAVSCAEPQVQSDFYRGLLSRQNSQSGEAAAYFEKALSQSNAFVRQAAAEELANLMYYGTELSARTINRIRKEAVYPWAAAFEAVDKKDKEKALEFLLNFKQGDNFSNEARLFVLREFEKLGVAFSVTESAAIEGHYAVFHRRYNDALGFFRKFMEETAPAEISVEWPSQMPAEFLKYPSLINDLGRAFQYTGSGSEGYDLFLKWEKNLPAEIAADDSVRYNLLFFAARIVRRRGSNEQALSLFEKARLLAPDDEQEDACIWYILDLSLEGNYDIFIQRLRRLAPFMHKDEYFDDIFERALQTLSSKKDWRNLIRTFDLLKNSSAVTTAGFAWEIARLIEEGYLSDEELKMAAQAAGSLSVSAQTVSAETFFQIAYDASTAVDSFAQYYRSLSAAALGLPFLEFSPQDSVNEPLEQRGKSSQDSPRQAAAQQAALGFLLGFFVHDAAEFSARYVRALEDNLSHNELRLVSAAFAKAEMYQESIRLISRYINREGYSVTREDMELFYPRPYKELIEEYAEEHGMTAPLLFGLIRTESVFQNVIVSHAGAVGLMQLIPETAEEMAGRIRRAGGPDFLGADETLNLNDPAVNIHIGAYYFSYLMGRFDDTLVSLLAYNGGMNRVRRWRTADSMPPDLFMETVSIYETRNYGRKVLSAAAVYEELFYNLNR